MNEKRFPWGFAAFLVAFGLVVVAGCVMIGYAFAEEQSANAWCAEIGAVAVDRAGGGYACVEEVNP